VDTIYDTLGRARQPQLISRIMWGVKNIRQWQFIQVNEGEYTIKLCTSGVVDEIDIRNRLHHVLGNDACVLIEYVEDVPVANSLKRRYIINKMSL
jgi:phenylacetate-CoA ligase